LDRYAGGDELIKLAFGLIATITAGALVGHGRTTVRAITPFMRRDVVLSLLSIGGLSLLVQLPMMVAYAIIAHALSPQTPIADIVAASAIVMFAASVPISFAGWGVREMSAVIALGTIGMAAGDALVGAIVIGAGSMLAMAAMAAVSLPGHIHEYKIVPAARKSIDYDRALAWALPLAAATFVLFQIYIPMPSGTLLNVNLADPAAILAGALFILNMVRLGRLPQWRFSQLNAVVAVATLVLGVSLVHGAIKFGWTEWALVNRFFGWFILLAYAMTGALFVRESGKRALWTILLTFAGAAAAIVVVEISLVLLKQGGIGLSLEISLFNFQGFSQNRNFFAFQLLMAIAASTVAARGAILRLILLTLMIAGLLFCGSRSGWITLLLVLGASIYMRAAGVREIAIAIISAVALVFMIVVPVPFTSGELAIPTYDNLQRLSMIISPSQANTDERLISIFGGLQLFVDHPVFGAGLGSFRNQMILGSSGIPLLIHSTAVWLLAEMGIIGFLVFAVPAIFLLFQNARCTRPDIASKLIVLSLVVFGCMSGPADMLYQRVFWLLLGAALAMPAAATSFANIRSAAAER